MAICPNCGTTNNDGSKFCYNCGGPIPAGQPAPQPQPVQQAAPQAPEGFQPIPKPSNGEFIPITPTNPLPNMTPIQPSYAQPITQPVQKPINKPKSNGFCNWGLALSIIGLCTLGSTSLLGLIFSVIGFFSARKKNQPGTGKAIVGTIMSGLIVIGLGFTFAICWNDLKDEFESGAISNPIEFIYALDHANDRNTSEYKEKLKVITDQKWVNNLEGDNSYLEFGSSTYKFCESADKENDNYESGKYRLYKGDDAMDQIERRYRSYISKSDINKLISKNKDYSRSNFIILTLESDNVRKDGKDAANKKTTTYYGFYVKSMSGTHNLVLINMVTGTRYEFVTVEYFKGNNQNK